ncbi:MAG: response regulator [Lachnospiraceae bacterium]|nr:response regulator [Lachnospiraceae bacterium]
MLVLKVIFVLLTFVSAGCVIWGAIYKRKNTGFLLTAAEVAVCDVLSFMLIGVQSAKDAKNILLVYYIVHAWLLFTILIMILRIERHRGFITLVCISGVTCAYQTYLAVSQFFGARIFSFAKKIYFLNAWWVATDTKNTGLFLSYRSYRIMTYINIGLILAVLIGCILRSHRIFRSRFIILVIMLAGFALLETLTLLFMFPVRIPNILYNIISIICLYITVMYPREHLREWSLDSFANDMSDGLILYDEHNDLIHINDTIKRTLGEELVEGFEDKEKLDTWIKNTAESDGDADILTYERDGNLYYFKTTVRELGERSKKIGTLYILHDTTSSITRIKTMEQVNYELERAAKMKSDFLANMSHEIRTPMNAVIGMAELALREEKSPAVMDYLLQIQSSGKNLLNIINDILDYSKIESGKMEIIEDDYSPCTELSDIANVLSTRIGDKKLSLFVIVDPKLPKTLYGDAMRIRQIIINLANNAIKFTKKGLVKIIVSCERVSEDSVRLIYHVIDTGIGIKEEDISKLFVSFQQLDSRRNRSVEGTGLGLAISQRLVDAMQGRIGVESKYGVGSDFWFEIPQRIVDDSSELSVEDAANKKAFVICEDELKTGMFDREMESLGVESARINSLEEYVPSKKKDYIFFGRDNYNEDTIAFFRANPDTRGVVIVGYDSDFETNVPNIHILRSPETTMTMVGILNDRNVEESHRESRQSFVADFRSPDAKILVVDDNAINITITEGLVAPMDISIDKAYGGGEAVDKVKNGDYDIVFMDHMMPEIDGVDATRMIRGDGSIRQPVIIALSANVMEEAKRLFEEAGMNDFVAKPIDIRVLAAKLKKWLPPEKIIEKSGEDMAVDSGDEPVLQIEGLDAESAVKALGSASLYMKVAGEYYRSGEDRYAGIEESYNKEDWQEFTIKVHALKSSSRQIGAVSLGDMAEDLEKAGKAGNVSFIREKTGDALNAFRELLGKLKEYFGEDETEDSGKPVIDAETLGRLLDELAEACDNLDSDAMDEIGERLKEYSFEEDKRGTVKALIKAIGDIDTDVCADLSEKLR